MPNGRGEITCTEDQKRTVPLPIPPSRRGGCAHKGKKRGHPLVIGDVPGPPRNADERHAQRLDPLPLGVDPILPGAEVDNDLDAESP